AVAVFGQRGHEVLVMLAADLRHVVVGVGILPAGDSVTTVAGVGLGLPGRRVALLGGSAGQRGERQANGGKQKRSSHVRFRAAGSRCSTSNPESIATKPAFRPDVATMDGAATFRGVRASNGPIPGGARNDEWLRRARVARRIMRLRLPAACRLGPWAPSRYVRDVVAYTPRLA